MELKHGNKGSRAFFFTPSLLLLLLLGIAGTGRGDELESPTCVQFFYKPDNPNCVLVLPAVDEIERMYAPNLTVERYVVGEHDYHAALLDAFFSRIGHRGARGVPAFFVGRAVVVGSGEPLSRYDEAVLKQAGAACVDPEHVLPRSQVASDGSDAAPPRSPALAAVLAFAAALTTVAVHPAVLVVFVRLLRALRFNVPRAQRAQDAAMAAAASSSDAHAIAKGSSADAVPEVVVAGTGTLGPLADAPNTEPAATADKAVDTAAAPIAAGTGTGADEQQEQEDAAAAAMGACARHGCVAAYLGAYGLLNLALGAVLAGVLLACIGTQTRASMFAVGKCAAALFALVAVLFVQDALCGRRTCIHMDMPPCGGRALSRRAGRVRSAAGALAAGATAFAVLLPLTLASQIACTLLVVARSAALAPALAATLAAAAAHVLPCVAVLVAALAAPATVDTIWRRLPARTYVLDLIVAAAAALLALLLILEDLVFDPK